MKKIRKMLFAAGAAMTLLVSSIPVQAAPMETVEAADMKGESRAYGMENAHSIQPMPGQMSEAGVKASVSGTAEPESTAASAPVENIQKADDRMAETGKTDEQAPETVKEDGQKAAASAEDGQKTAAGKTEEQAETSSKPTVTMYGESMSGEAIVSAAAKSDYDNIAISQVTDYVNVRSTAGTSGAIVGKIYNNAAADILETVDGEDGSWYKIRSGKVTGYIKAQYFITGEAAEAKAGEVGTSVARVSCDTQLRLREQPNTDSEILDLLSPNDEYEVIGEEDGFFRIRVDSDLAGYVSKDYIDTIVVFEHAVTLEEEAEKIADEERRKAEADAAIAAMNEVKAREQEEENEEENRQEAESAETAQEDGGQNAGPEPGSGTQEEEAGPGGGSVQAKETDASAPGSGSSAGPGGETGPGCGSKKKGSSVQNATRSAIVAYAKQFLGNPYVYGGTSLTNGTDCSGFTQGIYAHFGIATGRSSRDQAAKGREIAIQDAQPGDLLFYASGSYINHVAMYIGDGQIIHASTRKSGIKYSPYDYRTPCKAVTFLD